MRTIIILFTRILRQLMLQNTKLKEIKKHMAQIDDSIAAIQTAVSGVSTQIGNVSASLTAEIAQIAAAIAAGGVTQTHIDNLNAIATSLNGATASLQQLDTTIQGIIVP